MLKTLYSWYGERPVIIVGALLVVLILVLIIKGAGEDAPLDDPTLRTVDVATIGSLSGSNSVDVVGTVAAVREARIESETFGRVTAVYVSLGQVVVPGQIIAELENASERAAVLQAEGAYEAAIAGAGQANVTVRDAESSLRAAVSSAAATYRNAYTTADNQVRNTLDIVFATPNDYLFGFRLNAGNAPDINAERARVESILDAWRQTVLTEEDTDAYRELQTAEANVSAILDLVERVSQIAAKDENDSIDITGTAIETIRTSLANAQNTLSGTLQSIIAAESAVDNALEQLDRARLGGTDGVVSAANAQVKQALGALRLAEANLAKTVFRSPINGTVNQLTVKEGSFLGSFAPVANIANNNALEVTTFLGESDQARVSVGDTVLIEGQYQGIVTEMSPAVDPATKKVEVKIGTEAIALKNGDTVTISFTSSRAGAEQIHTVPLSAVKFTERDGVVLTVDDGVVRAHPVTLGDVRGSHIEILDGVTNDMKIIVDARGINAGQEVAPIDR